MKYRGRSDIVAEILKIAKDDGASKTRIMYGAYLSYAQLKDYMAVMLENGLLEKKDMKYQTTRKGLEFLRHHERMGSIFELPSEAKSAGEIILSGRNITITNGNRLGYVGQNAHIAKLEVTQKFPCEILSMSRQVTRTVGQFHLSHSSFIDVQRGMDSQ